MLTVCGGCVYSEAEVRRYKMMNNYPAMVYTLALTIPVSLVMMHQNTKVITVPKGLAVHKKNLTENRICKHSSLIPTLFFSEELKREKKKKTLRATNFPQLRMMTPLQYF